MVHSKKNCKNNTCKCKNEECNCKITLTKLSIDIGYGQAVEIFAKNKKLPPGFWKKQDFESLKKIISALSSRSKIREKAIKQLKKFL